MAKFTIDGKPVESPEGSLVIDAAASVGVRIPHYCYHPALGNPGNCRLCLVEVSGAPKPMVSCRLPVKEGLVVKTDSPAARRAQSSSLELHLVNHPLDCPVCDQAGECGLQDYYMEIGRYQSQVREDKHHKDKRREIGAHVMLDAERCILCTLCTRFTDQVTATRELGIFGRGHREYVDLAPGKTLDNAYSGNVVDICPVGALTDKDFRYQVRVWYLDKTESICPGCSRGCAISVETSTRRPWHNQGRRVARIKPRHDDSVNGWWICDEGRYSHKGLDEGRLGRVLRLQPERAELSWDAALKEAAEKIKDGMKRNGPEGFAVAASGALSNEDWAAFHELFVKTLGVSRFLFSPEPDQVGEEDRLLRRREKVPNLRGGLAHGFGGPLPMGSGGGTPAPATPGAGRAIPSVSWQELARDLEAGKIWGLYIVDRDAVQVWGGKTPGLLARAEFVIFQGPFKGGTGDLAHYRFPATAYVEEDGAFTNFEGKLRPYRRALDPIGEAAPDWKIFKSLAGWLDGHKTDRRSKTAAAA